MDAEKLLEDMKRLRKVKRPFNRKHRGGKKALLRRCNYRCNYCKQKREHLGVHSEEYHRVRKFESVEDVAKRYNTSADELLRLNDSILNKRNWGKDLLINVPGNSNAFTGKNRVVACNQCVSRKQSEGLTHPEYVYQLLEERRKERNKVTPGFQRMINLRDNYECHYCNLIDQKTNDKLTLDHLVPIADGGKTTEENVVTSCRFHNREKDVMPYKLYVDIILKRKSKMKRQRVFH